MKIIFIVIVLIVLLSILFYARMATGDEAIRKMNEEERKYLEDKLSKIEMGASYQEVVQIIGPPDRGGGTLRPTWKVEGSGNNQVAVYLSRDGNVRKIRWMSLGKFVWEKH